MPCIAGLEALIMVHTMTENLPQICCWMLLAGFVFLTAFGQVPRMSMNECSFWFFWLSKVVYVPAIRIGLTENHGQSLLSCGKSMAYGMWFGETCTFFPKIKQTSMGSMYCTKGTLSMLQIIF